MTDPVDFPLPDPLLVVHGQTEDGESIEVTSDWGELEPVEVPPPPAMSGLHDFRAWRLKP